VIADNGSNSSGNSTNWNWTNAVNNSSETTAVGSAEELLIAGSGCNGCSSCKCRRCSSNGGNGNGNGNGGAGSGNGNGDCNCDEELFDDADDLKVAVIELELDARSLVNDANEV